VNLTRRSFGSSLALAGGAALAGAGAQASANRPSAAAMREIFHRYIEQFNSGQPERLVAFFAPNVVLHLPGRELIGPEAITAHYRRSFGFLTEWLRLDALIVDEGGLAAELYTRFSAHRDYPDFKVTPLRAGDVYVVTTFVFYEFNNEGRFTLIRPAMWQRDTSGVRAPEVRVQ
jgi:hypothetical protein